MLTKRPVTRPDRSVNTTIDPEAARLGGTCYRGEQPNIDRVDFQPGGRMVSSDQLVGD